MIIVRLIILLFIFSMTFITYGSADIQSWVDENGVRHFSNVDTSQKSGDVKTAEEFKSSETANKLASPAKKPKSIEERVKRQEEICMENPSCKKEMERRKRYQEIQKYNEKLRLKAYQELEEKNKRQKAQICDRMRKELDSVHPGI